LPGTILVAQVLCHYTVRQKQHGTKHLSISSFDIDRLSKFFHYYTWKTSRRVDDTVICLVMLD